jgi:hypothetical protein
MSISIAKTLPFNSSNNTSISCGGININSIFKISFMNLAIRLLNPSNFSPLTSTSNFYSDYFTATAFGDS